MLNDVPSFSEFSLECIEKSIPKVCYSPMRSMVGGLRAARHTQAKDGFVAEFGVFRGTSLKILLRCSAFVYGFDCFDGLPEDWKPGLPKGTFKYSYKKLMRKMRGYSSRLMIYSGLFQDTIPEFLDDVKDIKARFIHIDCDLYSSTKDVLTGLESRIIPGTVITFDEIHNRAESLQDEARAFNEFLEKTGLKFKLINIANEQATIVLV